MHLLESQTYTRLFEACQQALQPRYRSLSVPLQVIPAGSNGDAGGLTSFQEVPLAGP
jgi:hypothetical protein